MVIEHFRGGDPRPIYRRFREQGRLAPEGLAYVASWVTADLERCYQVMECEDRALLDEWMSRWRDIVEFEVIPIVTSTEAAADAASCHPQEASKMPENLPPHVQLIQTATAYWASRVLYVAAKLGLADLLANEPQRAEDLAPLTKTHAPSLYRLMRALAALGLMTEDGERRFRLTDLGRALTSGAPGAARATVLTLAGDWAWHGFDHLLYSVETGKSGLEKALGEPLFDWMAKRPEEASNFSETMIGFHGMEPEAVAAAYDFSSAATIVDVGGASGNLLATIVGSHSGPRGVLFDMPHVVRDAPALLASRGLTQRISIESGSFFDRVPAGGDVYLLSHIIHDWSEPQCLTILGNCRQAMKPDGRLLIIEMVLPEGNDPHAGKMLDIMMLVGPGGQERTVPEYNALLGKAGLRLNRTVPTNSAVTIVEAVRA